jgi:hypothetical protein
MSSTGSDLVVAFHAEDKTPETRDTDFGEFNISGKGDPRDKFVGDGDSVFTIAGGLPQPIPDIPYRGPGDAGRARGSSRSWRASLRTEIFPLVGEDEELRASASLDRRVSWIERNSRSGERAFLGESRHNGREEVQREVWCESGRLRRSPSECTSLNRAPSSCALQGSSMSTCPKLDEEAGDETHSWKSV